MKKIPGLLLLLLITLNVRSQSLVDSLSNSRFTLEDSVGPALVRLAMKNPALTVVDKQIDASKYEWQTSKASWFNNIVANFNLNERNITGGGSDPESNVFYPRYNFSLNLPLGNFITKGK